MRNEIRDALNQGKVVTVHEKPLDYHGWKGFGYIILDPDTAAGAYKISGGANGGFLKGIGLGLLQAVAVIALSPSVGFIAGIAALIAGVIYSLTGTLGEQIGF